MTAISHDAIMLALRNQMLRSSSLPAARVYANETFIPPGNVPYIEEDFVPATAALKGLTQNGLVENTGLYIIRWFGVANTGLSDINNGVDDLLALFPPGSALTASDGTTVRIRGDHAPYRGQLRAMNPGYVLVVVTIPYRAYSLNNTTT